MGKAQSVKTTDIVLDKSIYPRSGIDHKRVSMFGENMRDGIKFDPIHLQAHPDDPKLSSTEIGKAFGRSKKNCGFVYC